MAAAHQCIEIETQISHRRLASMRRGRRVLSVSLVAFGISLSLSGAGVMWWRWCVNTAWALCGGMAQSTHAHKVEMEDMYIPYSIHDFTYYVCADLCAYLSSYALNAYVSVYMYVHSNQYRT